MPNNKTTAVFDVMNSTCKHVKNNVQAIKSYFKRTTSHFFTPIWVDYHKCTCPSKKETINIKPLCVIVKWVYLALVICQPLGISYSRGRSPRITDDKLTFVQIPTEYRKPYGGFVSFALGIILFINSMFLFLFSGISRK